MSGSRESAFPAWIRWITFSGRLPTGFRTVILSAAKDLLFRKSAPLVFLLLSDIGFSCYGSGVD